jgi:hypothetical protein
MLRWIKSTSFIFMIIEEGSGSDQSMFRSEYTSMNEDILLQKHQLGELKLVERSRELIQGSDELLAQVIVGGVVGARLNLELIERSRELIKWSDALLAQVIMGDASM